MTAGSDDSPSQRSNSTRTWSSRWFATKNYADLLHEDVKIRRFIKDQLYHAGIAKIDIERSANRARITIYTARPKATPSTDRTGDTHDRVRTDKVGYNGTVTLRVAGRLRHIGIGRTHAGTDILLLVQDLHVRIVHAATGELLRELTIDPSHDYQGTGRPPGPAPKKQ